MGVLGKLLCRLALTLRPFSDVGGLAANEASVLATGQASLEKGCGAKKREEVDGSSIESLGEIGKTRVTARIGGCP
jgi:hypothetical protein